jgi:hypothetical protein
MDRELITAGAAMEAEVKQKYEPRKDLFQEVMNLCKGVWEPYFPDLVERARMELDLIDPTIFPSTREKKKK